MLTCHFRSGKKYSRPLSACQITPTVILQNVFFNTQGRSVTSRAKRVIIYGDKYAAVYYAENNKPYIMKMAGIDFQLCSEYTKEAAFNYCFALCSLLLSLLIEYLCIAFLWPESGAAHSEAVMHTELSWLSSEFARSLLLSEPSGDCGSLGGGGLPVWVCRERVPGPGRSAVRLADAQ